MAIPESFEIKNKIFLSEDDLNGPIVKLKPNSEELFAIADSGSPMSFLNEKTAGRLQQNDKSALFKCILPDNLARNLACYNGGTKNPKGTLIITIESGAWKTQPAPFIIIDDQKANIIGRNILPQIGVKLIQEKHKQNVLSIREQEESVPVINQFSTTVYTYWQITNPMMKTQLNQDFMPIEQKDDVSRYTYRKESKGN